MTLFFKNQLLHVLFEFLSFLLAKFSSGVPSSLPQVPWNFTKFVPFKRKSILGNYLVLFGKENKTDVRIFNFKLNFFTSKRTLLCLHYDVTT